jgi:TIR domain
VAYKYSCFFSYRGANNYLVSDFILSLRSALLEIIGESSVFIDAYRLNAEKNKSDDDLAKALSQSACMLLIYTPNYFSHHYSYCTREYLAMQELEYKRLSQLKSTGISDNISLIVPIVFRGGDYLLQELAQRHPIFNFEDFLLADTDFDSSPKLIDELKKIAEHISKCNELLEPISTKFSNNFVLPPETDVDQFLGGLEVQQQPFPRRLRKTPVPLYGGI